MPNQKILLKRSATPGKLPGVGDLNLGEVALNTNDGRLFVKKEVSGVASIVELGVGPTFQLVAGGSPSHAHSVSITGQQALDLIAGVVSSVTSKSSSTSAHTHDVTIKYSAADKGFVLFNASGIATNHATAHTLAANGGGAGSMSELSDVDLTSVANNNILRYNSTTTNWEARAIHTDANTAPSSPLIGDSWYSITANTLYKRVNNGTSDIWLDTTTAGTGSLPSQGGHSGKVLTTNGSTASWGVSFFTMDGGSSTSSDSGFADLIFDLS